jgi:hypothetical protein
VTGLQGFSQEQRLSPRQAFSRPIELRSDEVRRILVPIDISVGGLGFACSNPDPGRTLYRVAFVDELKAWGARYLEYDAREIVRPNGFALAFEIDIIGATEIAEYIGRCSSGEAVHQSRVSGGIARDRDKSEAGILSDIARLVPEPKTWLSTPNASLAGKSPRELIGTHEEGDLLEMLRAAKYGLYS